MSKSLAKAMGSAACLPHPKEHYTSENARGVCVCGTEIVWRHGYVIHNVRGTEVVKELHSRTRCARARGTYGEGYVSGARW